MPAAYAKRSSKRAERPLAPRCGRAVLTALLCLSLAACAARQPADEHPLRVGTSDDYFPFSLSGAGFDVEVANAFARDHDYAIEWVSFDWPKLGDDLSSGKFDVAMSGVTWRPDRALLGRMSIAYAVGGPCWIGAERPERVGVNRGGFLERWAREYFTDAEIVSVEHNPDLPVLLAVGDVDAIVTDSFELSSFARPGDETRCLPPRDAKVYWTSPRAAPALSEQLNAWLARSEPRLQELRRTWFGRAMPRDEVDRMSDWKERRYREIIADHLEPAEGATSLLERLRGMDFRTAVGSSAPRANLDLVFGCVGLRDYFDACVSGEQVKHGKPAPDTFLMAAEELGLPPGRCAVVEDAVQGVDAGRAAGMPVAAVTTTRKRADLAMADIVVDSLAELDAEDFVRMLANQGK